MPARLSFDPITRQLRGTQATATYTLMATDVNGSTASATFTLTVEANPLPGFGDMVVPMRYPLNREVRQPLPAPTNPDNRDLTFVVTPALPTGLRRAADERRRSLRNGWADHGGDTAAGIHADGHGRRWRHGDAGVHA